ncbi:replicative DNA helicase [Sporichthya sp.]|uniref:replicative DNA helicase n=1 Tax=Sporichthya sp. TaxID=65475 RepID=UPI0018511888|nr:replicative DNA helicase [Sporichthya sp.]MBA3742934.1 replicative DNA helicase [Sporichthya sp.]
MSVVELPPPPHSEFERTPPQDLAAEQCVLGGMMLSKDAIADVIEALRGDDFYKPAHQLIFDAVLDLYGRGEPVDAITVSAELTKRGEIARAGGAPYLHTLLSSVPTAANAGYYAHIVAERAILRRLVEAGTRITQMGYSGDGEVDAIVDSAQAEIYQVTERRASEDYLPLSEIMEGTLDEIESIGNRGGQMIGVPTGFTELDQLTNGFHPGQMIIVAARPAIGKALALGTPLATPTGWTTMGEVQVGDELLGSDGRPIRVVAATEVMTGRPCFEVEFDDGSTIVADAEHQWFTDTRASRRGFESAAVRTTAEIARTIRCETAERRLNHSVRNAATLSLPKADLLLPPYVLGAWLGDGHSEAARFTTADPEIVMHLEAEGLEVTASAGHPYLYGLHLPGPEPVQPRDCEVCGRSFLPRLPEVRTCGQSCGGRATRRESVEFALCRCGKRLRGTHRGLCSACFAVDGTVQARLRTLGVIKNKHIPMPYLRGSEAQRRDLLAGLMDTDGTVNNTGSPQFTSISATLARDTYELICSLGYRAGISTRRVKGAREETSTAYTITFTTTDRVFRLERKHRTHKERYTRAKTTGRATCRFISDVRAIPSVPVRCVQVDAADSLYLAGRNMIPTHNSTVSLDFLRSCAIKHNQAAVVFSLEMGRNEITMRLLSAEAQVALHKIRSGTLTDEDWTRLARRMGEVSNAPLYIDDSPNLTMMEIRAKARRLKQRHDLRLIVIDYLQLMTSGKKVESRQQEVSEFSRSLKLMAKELEVPVVAISQLNRGPEQRTDKKPMLSDLRESGCLPASTRVLRADTGAETTMGELYATGARDVPVWALDDSLRYVRRHLTHVFSTGTKPVCKLQLASGKTVRATANHPFLTYDGWQALGDLGPGSRVAVPRHVPAPEQEAQWADERVIMLAHLTGDGSFVRRQPIRYASIDEANLAAVTEAAKHFGITAIRDDYPAARSHEKFVPEEVFSLPKRQIALFLHHLWATDGCITLHKTGRSGRVFYGSTSKRLVDDVSRLLLRFGLATRLRTTIPTSGHRPQYTLDISGAADQKVFLSRIGVHGARGAKAEVLLHALATTQPNTNVDTVPREVWGKVRTLLAEQGMTHREFAAAMGSQFCGPTMWKHSPSRERLGRVAAVLESDELELEATNDVFWDAVVAIEPDGVEEVYDATVLGTHNFIADGVAVHNSLEQDADIVILLHREDFYEKESPRAGEADLIVAKHRNGPTHTVTVAFQGHYSRFIDMAQQS